MGFLPEQEYEKRKASILANMSDPEKDRAKEVFNYFDEDKDQKIGVKEFQHLVFKLGEILTQEQVSSALKQLGGSDSLTFDDFFRWWKQEDREQQTEDEERLRFLRMKLTSESYFKALRKHLKSVKKDELVSGVDTYRADFSVTFGPCSRPNAGAKVHYEKNQEKVTATKKRLEISEQVFAVFTIRCSPDTTNESLSLFNNLLEPFQKQLQKEGLPIVSLTGSLITDTYQGAPHKFWKIVALAKARINTGVLGVMEVVGLKQLDVALDLTGEKLLEAKVNVAAEISKNAVSLLEGKDVPKAISFAMAIFGKAHTTFKFKGIGEGFSNSAFQEFFFKDLLDLRESDRESVRGKEAFTKLLGENDPKAFIEAILKEIFIYEREDKVWPFYQSAYKNFEGLGEVAVVAGDHILTVDFNVPNLKTYFASPDEIEEWKSKGL